MYEEVCSILPGGIRQIHRHDLQQNKFLVRPFLSIQPLLDLIFVKLLSEHLRKSQIQATVAQVLKTLPYRQAEEVEVLAVQTPCMKI